MMPKRNFQHSSNQLRLHTCAVWLLAAGVFGTALRAGAAEFPAEFELSDLAVYPAWDGFVLNGIDMLDYSGRESAAAADVNGDGVDDLILSASRGDPGGRIDAGETYIVFGRKTFPVPFLLSSLAEGGGNAGFVLNGIDADDTSGSYLGAGDVNGDGKDDLIIAAVAAAPGGRTYAGETYVVFGREMDFPAQFELSSLAAGDGSAGFVINGIGASDFSGGSAKVVGDVNGDGIDDLILGASGGDPGGRFNAGEAYVVFGRTTGFPAELELSDLAAGDGSTGFVLNGVDPQDWSSATARAGDLNDDGVDDLAIGTTKADPDGRFSAGEAYVVFGRVTGFPAQFELSSLATGNGSNGFVLNGIDEADGCCGKLSTAGDVNGDGVDDLIIGAGHADGGGRANAGEVYVVFGRDTGFPAEFELSSLAEGDGSIGFVLNGIDSYDIAGTSVGPAGDVNGDGVDDLIVGASGADPDGRFLAGESYVVFGRQTGFPAEFELSSLLEGDGSIGFVLNGIDSFDHAGWSVSAPGDVNDDGVVDLVIGTFPGDLGTQTTAGEAYVVFGRGPDTDNDGTSDVADNCIAVANVHQRDTDGDGHGNRCDVDLNQDCVVNGQDLGLFKSVFFTANANADFDGDGSVNVVDLGILRSLFFQPVGPSAPPSLCDSL